MTLSKVTPELPLSVTAIPVVYRDDGSQPAQEQALRSVKASGNGLQVLVIEDNVEMSAEIIACLAAGDLQPKSRFDATQGLRGGGDDPLVKPLVPSQLVVRIEVLLRRTDRSRNKVLALKVGDLELDLMAREAWRHRRLIELLPMEFKLLEFMMRNAGQTLSRRMIFEHVWEYNFDPGTHLIEVHIGRLRRKIDDPGMPSLIRTERGAGYAFNAV